MSKTIALYVAAAAVVLSGTLMDAPSAQAQFGRVVEVTIPAQQIPPPVEVRGRENRANNPYFGLRSSYSNVRQYYSNPIKTIPQRTIRTVVSPYGGYQYGGYGGYPVYPYQTYPRYPYQSPWGFR